MKSVDFLSKSYENVCRILQYVYKYLLSCQLKLRIIAVDSYYFLKDGLFFSKIFGAINIIM